MATAITRLENPVEIAQLLSRVHEHHSLLSVHVDGASGSWSSILLKLDLTERSLLLDELSPSDGSPSLHPGTGLLISTWLGGSHIEFHCNIRGSLSLTGGIAYQADWPHSVDCYERRHGYRLAVPVTLQLPPLLFNGVDGPLKARLVDISRDGLAAQLMPTTMPAVGTSLDCTMRLFDHPIQLDTEVRSRSQHKRTLRLGLAFSHLTPTQRHNLDASVAKLERNLLRHYAAVRR